MTFQVRFLEPAEREFRRLPRGLQVELKELVPYLEANPYRSRPFLSVKDVGQETVTYVGNIYKYYVAYKLAAGRAKVQQAAGQGQGI